MATITKGMLSETINNIKINTSYPCNSGNYKNTSSRDVKFIVMHYTGNQKDTPLNNCKYFQTSGRSASAHFFVGEREIYQSVELRDTAWHCGCSTGYKTDCRNANSFGIEMCTSGSYLVAEVTQINAAYLCAHLCKMLGITESTVDTYVLRHYDCVASNKKCPAQYVSNATQWKQFKTWVKNILKTGKHAEPTATTPVEPTLKINENVKAIQTWLNKYYKTGLTTDGIYGNNTKKALIKAWQTEVGLTADGDFGTKSKAKAEDTILKKGSKGILVTILQATLTCQGYSCNGIDGDFGSGCHKAVVAFQKKKGLTQDGIVGKGTWSALYA